LLDIRTRPHLLTQHEKVGEQTSPTLYNSRRESVIRRNMPMANLLLLLAILCAGASYAFYTADSATGDVPNWASDVCSSARTLCHNPQQMAIAAVCLAGLWILIKFTSALRG
jgi:hypothetical protein